MKTKEPGNATVKSAVQSAVFDLDSDISYLRERWPDVPEGVLLDALAILNSVRVNQ